jgi:hypothetical protein
MGCVRAGEAPAQRKALRFFCRLDGLLSTARNRSKRRELFRRGRRELQAGVARRKKQKARGNFPWLPKTNAQTEILGFFFRTHRFGRLHALDPLQARCLAL